MQTDSINRLNKIKSYQLKSFKSYLIGKELFSKIQFKSPDQLLSRHKKWRNPKWKTSFFCTVFVNSHGQYRMHILWNSCWCIHFPTYILKIYLYECYCRSIIVKKDLTVDDFRWDNKNCLFFASRCYQAYQQINNFLCMIYFS